MQKIGDKLLEIREKLGFTSARSFYLSLEEKADLEFNYAYYKKIENNEKLPSAKVLHGLAALMPTKYRDELVLCFCQQQFPQYEHLFENKNKKILHEEKIPKKKASTQGSTLIGQRELTERQIATLADHQHNFFLFSIITLARYKITREQLLEFYNEEELATALEQLQKVKLLTIDEEGISSSYPEYLYPKAETASLKALYAKLDSYEPLKLNFFKLQKKNKAHFLRRISPRYIDLLQSNVQLLYQTIRMADEHDVDQNDLVCSLEIRLDCGHLPG